MLAAVPANPSPAATALNFPTLRRSPTTSDVTGAGPNDRTMT